MQKNSRNGALKIEGLEREEEPTKERVLHAAAEIFSRKGFAGATTREIAEAAGVNVSTLHYHWESKENLYLAVLSDVSRGLADIASSWEAKAAREEIGDAENQEALVRESVGELIDYVLESRIFARLMSQKWSAESGAPRDVENKILVPLGLGIARALGRAFERGLGRPIDPMLLTLDFVWLSLGYLIGGPLYEKILGGGLEDAAVRARVREHMTELAMRIMGVNASTGKLEER